MKVGFTHVLIDEENCVGTRRPVLYKTDVLDIVQRQVLKTEDELAGSSVVLNLRVVAKRELDLNQLRFF